MDLEELRAFLEVVDAGSVLAAADARGQSRTTLKRRIEALEARAGVVLLRSTPRGIVLTDAGRTLLERGRHMEQEVAILLSSLRRVGLEPEGQLRVVLPVGMPTRLVTQVVGEVRARWPALRLNLSMSRDPMSEDLSEVDLVLHFSRRAPAATWVSIQLVRVRVRALAHGRYLERRGTPRTVEDLADHDLLSWCAPGEDPTFWRTTSGSLLRVSPVLTTADIHQLRDCCLEGHGIALIPDALLPLGLGADGSVIPVLPQDIGDELTAWVSAPAILADTPKVKRVLDVARAFFHTATGLG